MPEIYSVDAFSSMKENSFPSILCTERNTLLLKGLLGVHFSLPISPEPETIWKVPTLTGKGKPTSKHLLHHIFSVGERDLVGLDLTG